MTNEEYCCICNDYSVHPSIAMENENVIAAIKQNNKVMLKEILETEF